MIINVLNSLAICGSNSSNNLFITSTSIMQFSLVCLSCKSIKMKEIESSLDNADFKKVNHFFYQITNYNTSKYYVDEVIFYTDFLSCLSILFKKVKSTSKFKSLLHSILPSSHIEEIRMASILEYLAILKYLKGTCGKFVMYDCTCNRFWSCIEKNG